MTSLKNDSSLNKCLSPLSAGFGPSTVRADTFTRPLGPKDKLRFDCGLSPTGRLSPREFFRARYGEVLAAGFRYHHHIFRLRPQGQKQQPRLSPFCFLPEAVFPNCPTAFLDPAWKPSDATDRPADM